MVNHLNQCRDDPQGNDRVSMQESCIQQQEAAQQVGRQKSSHRSDCTAPLEHDEPDGVHRHDREVGRTKHDAAGAQCVWCR